MRDGVTVGVLSPSIGGFYFGDVMAGIQRVVAAAGGHVVLVQTLDAGESGDELLPVPAVTVPVASDVDGVIAVTEASTRLHLDRLRAAGTPVVLASNYLEGFDGAAVVGDNVGGVRASVDHLVGHGHGRIAFVGSLLQSDMAERHDAYLAAAAAHGLPTEGLHVPTVDHVENGGAGAAEAVVALHREHGVTAVVTSTDRIAVGLVRALAAHGVDVPRDLAVVGFDDAESARHLTPPLATVDQQVSEIGARAAELLLAEIAGEQVPHTRHTVPSVFITRASCGCVAGAGAADRPRRGVDDAHRVVALVRDHLEPDGRSLTADEVDLDALDDRISALLGDLFPTAPSPETLERFTTTVITELGQHARELDDAGLPGADLTTHAMVRTTTLLGHRQSATSLERADRLLSTLTEQYDVGLGLLGRVGRDPADLRWLEEVSVRVGCLGLWEGDPESGLLRVAGVYDPDGRLDDVVDGAVLPVEAFPPRAVVRSAEPGREAVQVIPVRGTSGDHGFLCVVGPVDTYTGTARAAYNHWGALLGVALQQQVLLEEMRRSEERYALAADATHDGLWDWDVVGGECFFSARCREMLDTDVSRARDPRGGRPGRATAPELDPWMSRVHPDDRARLRREVTQAVRELRPIEVEHRLADGDGHRWVVCRAVPVGEPGSHARRVVGSLADIHERKELEQQLRQGALYDTLTGLPNRRLFLERLSQAVEQSRRGQGPRFAVVFLDLDGFKLINDSLGHLMGDELLKAIAERLRSDLRAVDTAARFGGDEFAVLLMGLRHVDVLAVAGRIQERIAAPVTLGDQVVSVSASVGITTSDTPYDDAEDVLRDADIAMYHAKDVERGTASVFDPVMHSRATARLQALSELREALADEQFVVHYQPVVQMGGAPLRQFEALVRWQHPTRGLLGPHEFLPVMQETGTVVPLGHWILDRVCAQVAAWRSGTGESVQVAVNLSHREFWAEGLVDVVAAALRRHEVPASSLVIEITESVIMADPAAARQVLVDLHGVGVDLHIDDFGTGQSSLGALRAMPVDGLKIDRSFVAEMSVDPRTAELVRVIVEMGRVLGLDVVAEGVETLAQADRLRGLGCETAQGWLYARAMPGDEAGALLGSYLTVPVGAPRPAAPSPRS